MGATPDVVWPQRFNAPPLGSDMNESPPVDGARRGERLSARPNRSRRFAVLNNFVDRLEPDLTASEVRIWLRLFRRADQNNVATISMTELALGSKLSRQTVNCAVKGLISKGVVKKIYRGHSGGFANKYALLSPDRVVKPA